MYKTEKCCQVTTGLQILHLVVNASHMYQWTGAFKKLMKHKKVLAGSFYLFSPPGAKRGKLIEIREGPSPVAEWKVFSRGGQFQQLCFKDFRFELSWILPSLFRYFSFGDQSSEGSSPNPVMLFPTNLWKLHKEFKGRGWNRRAPRLGIRPPQVVFFLHTSAAEGLPISVYPPAAGEMQSLLLLIQCADTVS